MWSRRVRTVVFFAAVATLVGSIALNWRTAAAQQRLTPFDEVIETNIRRMTERGREIFRFDTFGSELFWGQRLRLHEAIAGAAFGGVGAGLSPATALALGLKVDTDMLPPQLFQALARGQVDLNNPTNTLALLDARAVIGVTAFKQDGRVISVGIQCSLCHSTVDNSLAPGLGRRLDGWPNRDLNVGAIAALAPDLGEFTRLLQVDDATVRRVLNSWGPGKFDAQLVLDGKAFRPDGRSAATLIPAAFGLAGVNLHTYTGWGSVTYWNAFVANLEMHGCGKMFDPRLNNPAKFPVAARAGFADWRPPCADGITARLADLHFYQLGIPAPQPPAGSFDQRSAERGQIVFNDIAGCARCHIPPLFTEPGWQMHTGAEIGIDDFQAMRSPDERYRTTPLRGVFTRQKGGFYHDGRFPDLRAVVEHYDQHFRLRLTETDKLNLIEYLKSL